MGLGNSLHLSPIRAPSQGRPNSNKKVLLTGTSSGTPREHQRQQSGHKEDERVNGNEETFGEKENRKSIQELEEKKSQTVKPVVKQVIEGEEDEKKNQQKSMKKGDEKGSSGGGRRAKEIHSEIEKLKREVQMYKLREMERTKKDIEIERLKSELNLYKLKESKEKLKSRAQSGGGSQRQQQEEIQEMKKEIKKYKAREQNLRKALEQANASCASLQHQLVALSESAKRQVDKAHSLLSSLQKRFSEQQQVISSFSDRLQGKSYHPFFFFFFFFFMSFSLLFSFFIHQTCVPTHTHMHTPSHTAVDMKLDKEGEQMEGVESSLLQLRLLVCHQVFFCFGPS